MFVEKGYYYIYFFILKNKYKKFLVSKVEKKEIRYKPHIFFPFDERVSKKKEKEGEWEI